MRISLNPPDFRAHCTFPWVSPHNYHPHHLRLLPLLCTRASHSERCRSIVHLLEHLTPFTIVIRSTRTRQGISIYPPLLPFNISSARASSSYLPCSRIAKSLRGYILINIASPFRNSRSCHPLIIDRNLTKPRQDASRVETNQPPWP